MSEIEIAPTRPVIDVSQMHLPTLATHAADAIDAGNVPPVLFRYAADPVRIEIEDGQVPRIRRVTLDILRHHLARWAEWQHWSRKGDTMVTTAPPMPVVRDLLAAPDLMLPRLDRIVCAPVFDRHGALCEYPGYSGPASGIYYAPGDLPLHLGAEAMSLDEARTLIVDDLLGDFPFIAPPELAHAVALLLPFARALIDGPTPLHLIEKPSPGTGASLLVTALLWPALGHDVPMLTEGRDEDEWRKRLMSKLATSPTAIVIDNLRRRLDSAALASNLTQTVVEDRLLATMTIMSAPVTCAWVATGNNPALSNEIARRTIRIRLDARVDRPWLRGGFRHENLREWIQARRPDLIAAALVLVGRWIDAGRPPGTARMGMYEAWSTVMGGILAHAEIRGFLENLDEFYDASDDETATWAAFVNAWADRHGAAAVGVAELYSLVTADLPLDLGDKGERSQRTRLGKLVGSMRDRSFGGHRIVAAPPYKGSARWRLVPPG